MSKKILFKTCRFCHEDFENSGYGNEQFCSDRCRYLGTKKRLDIQRKKPEAKAKFHEYMKRRYNENPDVRLKANISNEIYQALKGIGGRKSKRTFSALPYTLVQLKVHIESFFNNANGFTWDNYGSVWHLDHIIPKSLFRYDSMDSKSFRDCWALSNLRPYPAGLNYKKSNKIIGEITSSGHVIT